MTVRRITYSRADNMALLNERLAEYNEAHNNEIVFALAAGQNRLCLAGGEFPVPLSVEGLRHILEDDGVQWSHPYRDGTDPTHGRGIPREWLADFITATESDIPSVPVIMNPDILSTFKNVCICRAQFAGICEDKEIPEAVPVPVTAADAKPAAADANTLGAVAVVVLFVIGFALVLFDMLRWRIEGIGRT